MNFDELILEAAKSIAKATSALIRAATEAQRELVTQGKVSKSTNSLTEDGQWSEGLVSAARMVAAATHNLCEAANALVQGRSFCISNLFFKNNKLLFSLKKSKKTFF